MQTTVLINNCWDLQKIYSWFWLFKQSTDAVESSYLEWRWFSAEQIARKKNFRSIINFCRTQLIDRSHSIAEYLLIPSLHRNRLLFNYKQRFVALKENVFAQHNELFSLPRFYHTMKCSLKEQGAKRYSIRFYWKYIKKFKFNFKLRISENINGESYMDRRSRQYWNIP